LPDLILCDIDLKNSPLDGIETASYLNKITTVPIVFLTAFGDSETVERAKKLNPAYYLVKPCNTTQLEVAIGFAIANFSNDQVAHPAHSLQFHDVPQDKLHTLTDSIFIKNGTTYHRVKKEAVIWVEAMGPIVKIVTDDATFTYSTNLSNFLKQVAYPDLLRIHRSFVINVQKIVAFHSGAAIVQFQNDQKEIPVGTTYRSQFPKLFPKLLSD